MSIDLALYRLLFDRSLRESFLRGDHAALGFSPAELEALSTIDEEQLRRASRLAGDSILRRSHRGTGSLLDSFPETIAAWRRDHAGAELDALADELTASPHFERYRALPTCESGISLEEVFLRFADDNSIGDPTTRKMECATALLQSLAITARPSFVLPSFVRVSPKGHFAILGEGDPVLVAAANGRFIRGPITPFLAALLVSGEPPAQIAVRFGVGDSALAASCDELRRLGLLD